MDLHLILAATPWFLDPGTWLTILKAAFALGAVIFVHELGHFLVAKACGVKCEKFYLGFDVAGLKLFSFKWGETEYGIGLVPLGGYVKMLGQDDNPSRQAQEIERSKLKVPAGSDVPTASESAPPVESEPLAEPLDPRSYLAQSVPERMAIISAGVIMNLLFAVLFATVAYKMGVKYTVCGVSSVTPGDAAWRAGFQPGDRILQIGEEGQEDPHLRFADLFAGVALGNLDDGLKLKVERDGSQDPFWVTVYPDPKKKGVGRPTIGAVPPSSTTLFEAEPTLPFSPAGQAEVFKGGDRLIGADGREIRDYRDWVAALAAKFDQPIEVTAERKVEEGNKSAPERVTASVAPNPMRDFGLVMTMGPIKAVRQGSPAAKAGLLPGDRITAVDGQPVGDPLSWPQRLARSAATEVRLALERGEQKTPLEKTLSVDRVDWFEDSAAAVSVPQLGLAYTVDALVSAVEPNSAAASAGVIPGDRVVSVRVLPYVDPATKEQRPGTAKPLEFDAEQPRWPAFIDNLQNLPPDVQVKFTLQSGGKSREPELTPRVNPAWFNPHRGFVFESLNDTRVAVSWGEAFRLGVRETWAAAGQVVMFLRALGSRQISADLLGGPGSIAVTAGSAASAGLPQLLLFLTMLSANLAVVNFLPIPVLDGGHMMFLLYEGIRGKPASERVMTVLSYAGLFFILGLMIYVIGLDLGRLADWLRFG